jgi:peroxiredoxin
LRWIFIGFDFSALHDDVNHHSRVGLREVAFPPRGGEHYPMALTSSKQLAAGTPMPAFSLPDVATGATVAGTGLTGAKASVVIFLCRHCPYVVHVLPEVIRLSREYQARGISFVGISANDAAKYPEDAPAKLAGMIAERGIPFPILHDETQDTARAFGAVCTPEFFVFDGPGCLHYHGRLDGSTPGNGVPCDGSDLRRALDAVLRDAPAPSPQHPSMGCSIKWK